MAELFAVTVPKWGFSMEEGTIVAWRVAEGSAVSKGDELVDIETTKITNSVEAQQSGTLLRIVAEPGQTLPCGQLIAVIGDGAANDAEIAAFADGHAKMAMREVAEEHAPAQVAFTEAGGARIRYLEMGKGGVPVVFIHGFGGDLENWMFNQPALAATRRTIALDLPGHGGSTKEVGQATPDAMARVLSRALDNLGVGRAHFVGHSFGGAVALAVARGDPARVASLTAIAPAGLGEEISSAYVDGFVSARRRADMSAVVSQLFADPSLATRDMAEALLRYKRLDGVDAALKAIIAANFEGGRQHRADPDGWKTVAAPLLVLWGAEDRIIPRAHIDRAPSTAKKEVLPGAGHLPHLEKADAVNALLAAHIGAVAEA